MNRFTSGICSALLMMGFATTIQAQEPAWVGTFINEQASDKDIQAAIDEAVADMNFITRSVARGRLKKTNPAYRRIAIARDASTVSVKLDDRKPIEMPADGSAVKWTREDGEIFDVSVQAQDATLVQTFKAEDGQRINTFNVDDSGEMTLEVEVTSPRLSAPLTYSLHYGRVAAAQ